MTRAAPFLLALALVVAAPASARADRLVFACGGGNLCGSPLDGSPRRVLVDRKAPVTAFAAARDGRRIAYVLDHRSVRLARRDGGGATRLPVGSGSHLTWLLFSADGRRLHWGRGSGGFAVACSSRLDGRDRRCDHNWGFTVTGRGRTVLAISHELGHICRSTPAGGCDGVVAEDERYDFCCALALSPDGRSVATIASATGGPRRVGIYATSSARRRGLVGADATRASWSPDGRWVVYRRGFGPRFYRVRTTGGRSSRLPVPSYPIWTR